LLNIDRRDPKFLAILAVVLVALGNTLYNATLPLHVDEAYYWMMSKHLAHGYFDIPPMLAYLIALFGLAGDAEWLIRLVSISCIGGSALVVRAMAAHLYNERAALWATLIFLALPVTQLGFSITTTDAPNTLFWLLASYAALLALERGETRYFVYTGLCVGLGLLSKYTSVLLPVALFLFVLWRQPRTLLGYRPWLAVVVGMVVFSPAVYWNYQQEWAGFIFRYQFGSGDSSEISLEAIGNYIGGVLVLMTPVFFYAFFESLLRKRYRPAQGRTLGESWLLFLILFVLLFFLYKGLSRPLSYNWFSLAAVSATIYMGGLLERMGQRRRLIIGIAIAVLMSALIKFPDPFKLPPMANMKSRVMGFEEALAQFDDKVPADAWLCGDYYSTTSIAAYHLGHDRSRVLEPFTANRGSDYDYWQSEPQPYLDCYLFIDRKPKKTVKELCTTLQRLNHYDYRDPRYLPREYDLYHCVGERSAAEPTTEQP
jgi:4-amino-4-deoxy-L-arabinose transferase-like glycosyltransferase